MHRMYKQISVLAAICLLSAPALAAKTYKVTAEIRHADSVVGEPTLVVKDGVPGTVAVHGDSGYRLQITVSAPDQGDLDIAAKVDTAKGSVSTAANITPGKPMVVSTGDLGLSITVEPGGS